MKFWQAARIDRSGFMGGAHSCRPKCQVVPNLSVSSIIWDVSPSLPLPPSPPPPPSYALKKLKLLDPLKDEKGAKL